jgi:predicted N-acetyltransferase YhbS
MIPSTADSPADIQLRPLTARDLDAVVELDRRITKTSRGGYFAKRLEAALRHPKRHLQLAATAPAGLVGFVLARAAGGEFGRQDEVLALEAVGVDPAKQHAGIGQRMVWELGRLARDRGMRSAVTQVDWRDHAMLRFLDGAKFRLAPELLLERAVSRVPLPPTDEEIETPPPLVRHLRAGDLGMIRKIDHRLTGRDRSAYLERKVDEALHESAIAMSLVAEDDGFVVAFATAHVDFGDFGHMEPVASLETIGVNPDFAHRGFARAILDQMIDNLAALHVERLETEVARDNFELLRFLYRFGFGPSQRLPFVQSIKPV